VLVAQTAGFFLSLGSAIPEGNCNSSSKVWEKLVDPG
jgi:hypothetical protein